MFRRLCLIQSQMYSSVARQLAYSPNKFKGFPVNPSVRKKSNISFRSINNIEKETKTKIENDPKVIELEKALQCTKPEAISVYVYFTKNAIQMDLKRMNKTLKWLHRLGAEISIILENCHLFLVPLESLKKSYTKLNGREWKRFIDFMPLLSISESKITGIQHVREIRNRVYLFSEYFSCEPHIVSHYCAKHLFMFEMDLDLLKRKMALLENNVSPDYILRDLDLLARAENKIKARIEYLKKCDIGNVMPWMLKCEDRVLHRTIEKRKKVPGPDSTRNFELLQKRLDLHGQTANALFKKNDFLRELSYETVSGRLEELLKIFTPEDVKNNIKLLNHPVTHIRIRVAELIALDPSNISPKLFSMSERKFIEYKNAIKEINDS